jgi:hypothetical protein
MSSCICPRYCICHSHWHYSSLYFPFHRVAIADAWTNSPPDGGVGGGDTPLLCCPLLYALLLFLLLLLFHNNFDCFIVCLQTIVVCNVCLQTFVSRYWICSLASTVLYSPLYPLKGICSKAFQFFHVMLQFGCGRARVSQNVVKALHRGSYM